MNDIIAETLQAATDAKKNTIKHEMTVQIDATKMVEKAIQAWGASLQNSRGAPNWYRVEPIIQDINLAKSKLTIVSDQDGRGALLFELGPQQIASFGELRSILEEIAAKVGVSPESVAKAAEAFAQAIEKAQLAEPFSPDMGGLAASSFLEKTSDINPVVSHDKFGELDAKSLVSLSKIKAPTPLAGVANSDDVIAAQMPKAMPASDMSRYHSMGQMVKASDAAALSEYIDWAKKEKHWDETKEDACSKLGWVASSLGSIETMKVLLEKGKANIDFSDGSGLTCLMVAIANNHPKMIDFLIAEGADKRKTPVDGRSAIMLAASHDAVDSIKKLHQLGFDINERSLEGRTALHHAALGEEDKTSVNAVKTLIELGANPTIVDDIGADGGCLAEEYVDETSDSAYSTLTQFRKDWEAGKTGPQSSASSAISKARAVLGF